MIAIPAVGHAAPEPPPTGGAVTTFSERLHSFLPPAGDVAMMQVVSVFGPAVSTATGFEASAQVAVLGVTLSYFLTGVFVISIFMALYLVLAGTAQSAHSGQFLGERWHSLWVPLRAVLGWMMLLPIPALGGLGGIHALLFWVLALGTGFANKVGLVAIESATADSFVANANTLTAEPLAAALARQTFNSLTCVDTINRVESIPNDYPTLGVFTKQDQPASGPMDRIGSFFSSSPKAAQYNDSINAAAAQYGVPASFIHAIISAESSYNIRATSPVGAMGLMQLMPATAARFGVTNAYDPQQNIHGGTQYLAFLLKKFNGDFRLAAAGYNAGEGAVDKYGGIPPYKETQGYVVKVMNNFNANGGGLPGEVAGTTMQHYLFGGGKYAVDLCGDISIPVHTVSEDTAANGIQTAMRNDIQSAHLAAYNHMLTGMREVLALMQAGDEIAAQERYAQLVQEYAKTVFEAGSNAYQTRQADMIAQWKASAAKDGWATYGMWFWQLSEASLSVSTAVNEMMGEQKGFKPELASLAPQTAAQVRMAMARNDTLVDSLLAAQQTGTDHFASWRATQNGSANFNYALPQGGRAFDALPGNDLLRSLGEKLLEAFRWLQPSQTNEFPLLTWYRFGHTLMSVGAGAMVVGAGVGLLSTAAGLLVASIGAFVYGLGWMLAFYLSYLPLIIWLFQFLAWLVLAIIAAFGMPLWMLMHLSGEGDGISGARAQSGYGLLLSLLLKPVLLVFGLVASMALLYVLGWFVNATMGTTFKNPPNSVFEAVGLATIYILLVISLATLCLRVISLVPELAFRWIDVVVGSSFVGAGLQDVESGVKGLGRGLASGGERAAAVTGEIGQRYRHRKDQGTKRN
jgi:conjugal transfer/type IV secretion protein DotA/TraY